MTKFYLELRGYGKSSYFVIIPITESKAKKLKKEGIKIYNSKNQALEEIRKK